MTTHEVHFKQSFFILYSLYNAAVYAVYCILLLTISIEFQFKRYTIIQ